MAKCIFHFFIPCNNHPMPLPPGIPTLPELLCFSSKKLNISVEVGTKYLQFGIFLLEDKNGAIVDALETEYSKKAERINVAILLKWLLGNGVKPVTWSTLVTVLQSIEMKELANEIETHFANGCDNKSTTCI